MFDIDLVGFFPKNITGFGKPVERTYEQQELQKLFYHAAKEIQAQILSWDLPVYPKNFQEIILAGEQGKICCLVHETYSYAAFQNEEGKFLDDDRLTALLSPTLICLSTEILESTFDLTYFTFDPQEQKECIYWKPQRVGEVVFNSWD